MNATGALGRRSTRDWRAYGLLSPFVALCVASLLVPVMFALYLAFTNIQLIGPTATHYSFTGLSNLRRLVSDTTFWHSLLITLLFVIGGTAVAQTVIGTGLSVVLGRVPGWLRTGVMAVTVVAWVVPEVVVGLTWYALAQPGGVLGQAVGAAKSDLLLHHALLIVIGANVWHNVAFTVLIVTAGLRAIPSEVLEAARVDGAGTWSCLRRVTIPLLRTTLATNVVLSVLQSLSVFTLIYVMTQGGPLNATMTLPIYAYEQGFANNSLGYGTLMAVVLLIVGVALAAVMVRQVRSTAAGTTP